MAIRIFHLPKSKKFNYKPRFYDEQKEDLENRIEQIKREMGKSDNKGDKTFTPNIKGRMRGNSRRSQEDRQKSNIRLVFILFLLALIAYFMFFAK
ncbi:MAG: hypothetical protein AB7S50_08445 [Bacteroidales bacterium]